MRIVREPTIYLVGRQTINEEVLTRFLEDHDVATWTSDTDVAGQKLSEMAGRVCYMSFAAPRPGGNQAYLNRILQQAHGSVMEHAVWNFVIVGVSRSFTHELVRHRAGFGYSQLSQRYVDESTADFVEPDVIADDPECHAIFQAAIADAHAAYIKLVERLTALLADEPDRTMRRKMARQAARCVLPNATETKIFVTANARALRHFIELRGSEHAEPEIRKVAVRMCEIMQQEAGNLFGDYTFRALPDGSRVVETSYHKV
jgi:thymidylate synthase (FAD)